MKGIYESMNHVHSVGAKPPTLIMRLAFVVVIVSLFFSSCGLGPDPEENESFTFGFVDVGQGLSQVGIVGDTAIVWDCGREDAALQWQKSYSSLSRPYIAAVVVSHSDEDHFGGIRTFPSSIGFSGVVVVGPHEDTAALRSGLGAWSTKVRFRTIEQGDTLGGLSGVKIDCLWPPRELPTGDSPSKNYHSLCFRVTHGDCSALITSDIDSVACRRLALTFADKLRCDILVVPHHGSKGSFHIPFYGHAAPQSAVISSGAPPNSYGHPSEEVLDLLVQMGVRVYATYDDGDLVFRSNGYYFERMGDSQ